MASANGNTIQHWRADVEASVSSKTETTATITVKCYWRALGWGYDVAARGYAGLSKSDSTPWKVFTAYAPKGGNNRPLVTTYTKTVNKQEHSFSQSCLAVIEVTGGYHNGRSEANTSVTVPAKTRKNPGAPTLTISPTTATPSKAVTLSWSANPNGTNLHFKEWRLTAKKPDGRTVSVYTGTATSKTITPSIYGASDTGGTITFEIAAVYLWDNKESLYKTTKALTIPARKNPKAPTLTISPTKATPGQKVTAKWSTNASGTNLSFKEWRLTAIKPDGKRVAIYTGKNTSIAIAPGDYVPAAGGVLTLEIAAVYLWDNKESLYKTTKTVEVLGGSCTVYGDDGKAKKALIVVYDEKGSRHFVNASHYDAQGKKRQIM